MTIKMNNYWDDLSGISAKLATLAYTRGGVRYAARHDASLHPYSTSTSALSKNIHKLMHSLECKFIARYDCTVSPPFNETGRLTCCLAIA